MKKVDSLNLQVEPYLKTLGTSCCLNLLGVFEKVDRQGDPNGLTKRCNLTSWKNTIEYYSKKQSPEVCCLNRTIILSRSTIPFTTSHNYGHNVLGIEHCVQCIHTSIHVHVCHSCEGYD